MELNRIAKIDLKKLTLVLFCLAVVILMLYAQLHTRKHNKAFIEEHVGAFDKLSAPKAEGYLGCYIPSYWPDKGARIPYRNTVNAKECILYCQASSYMYANFRPVDEFCQCDNDFLTRGLSTLPCGKDSPKAVEVYTAGQITDIKYSLLSKHWRSGSCNCTDSECNTLSCLPTEGMCWVGPRSKLLNVIQDTECKHIAVERFDVKGASSQHCVESLNGFLPANCKPWTVKDSEQHLNRFYKVKLTKGTKKVTVPLNPPKNQKKVLLVTYMRSGSTFTSEFFKGYPNSYYLFEPLRGLIPTKTRTHEELPVNGNLEGRSTDLLADLLRCELDKAPLTSIAFSIRKMNDFLKACSVVEHESRLSCMQAHSSSCLSSDMIAIKVIRAKIQWTRQLLENEKYQLENLKIVYLIRDPRAIINSRLKLRLRSTMTNFETHVKSLCASMVEDIRTAQILKQSKYRDQVLVLRYEDIVEDNIAAVKHIYKSLSLGEVPKSLAEYVRSLSKMSSIHYRKGYAYSTHRENSLKTAHRWKGYMNYEIVKDMDNFCAEVYKLAGYLPVDSKQALKNVSIYHMTEKPALLM